ncbi:MAG: iron-sulfur cluster assembly scaffold protein [Sphingomonadaceae bacterium]|nr:iron-sulfur cluster assembly scaffold protein [Sphingomonadaceae bacterium]
MRLAENPLDPALPLTGEARSRSCGSTLSMRLAVDREHRIETIGIQAAACAIGQASAAIFAGQAIGRDASSISATLVALECWLTGESGLPDWPELSLIAPARDHPARHGAILLPWKAALEALSKA